VLRTSCVTLEYPTAKYPLWYHNLPHYGIPENVLDSDEEIIWSEKLICFLNQCLAVKPDTRTTAALLLEHPFISSRSVERDGMIGDRFENWLSNQFSSLVFGGA